MGIAIVESFDEQLKEQQGQENPIVYYITYSNLSEDGQRQRMGFYKILKNELFSLADRFDFVKMTGKYPVLAEKAA